ncbi:MAG TPA: hypothetical protein VN641_09890 [Urbifossiella sp.]|nr:hypothetical protein [Urbifossiella sp.]
MCDAQDENSGLAEKKKPEPLLVDSEERLDWDFYQPPPPPKRRWTVQARIVWKGPAKPLPAPDPNDE